MTTTKILNEQPLVINHIETILRNTDENRYFPQRFDQKYIVDFIRKALRKKGFINLWSDEKLYEFAFNSIEFIVITYPKYIKIRNKLQLTNNDIAKIFNYKSGQSFTLSHKKHIVLRTFNDLIEQVLPRFLAN